jgi:hypothetical protein
VNSKHVPWIVAGVLGAVVVGGLVLASSSSSSGVDDGRPILVVGDSYAVGLAAALRRMFPGRSISSVAKGGQGAYYMTPIQETDGWVIVSAGTNDAAGAASPSDIADRVLRVLGPYADCSARRGGVAYIEPHSKMGGKLGERVAMVRAELVSRGLDRASCLAVVPIRPAPSPVDNIHFSPEGYETIAGDAVKALASLRT